MSAAAEEKAAAHWIGEVSKAAVAFDRRWTMLALQRVDGDLARRVEEQRALFDKACFLGPAGLIETHGAAMCRGWMAAVRTMEAAQVEDDAYILGRDPRTGFQVAIGHQRAAADRVADIHGQAAVWITPDEVAAVLAGLEGFKALASIKRMFPGAEVVDIRPREPAKADSGVAAA